MSNADWYDREIAKDNIKCTRAKIHKGWVLSEEEYDQYHKDLKLLTDYNNERLQLVRAFRVVVRTQCIW